MEQAAAYGSWPQERPKLTVVKDGGARYSALPHEIMRDRALSRDARLLYAILQGYWWQDGECFASHATLADDMDCSPRMLRTYLNELLRAGKITEHEAGTRRQKVYRPRSIGSTVPIEAVNEQPASDSTAVNRKFPTVQSEIIDSSNRSIISDSYKKTPEKKTPEETLPIGSDAADAAEPATVKPTALKSRGTRCPEMFDLTERHLAYAATQGFTPAQARAETDKFLAHHRFKGTIGVDWYAGWQNWLRNAVQFAKRDGRKPPGAPSVNGASAHANQPSRLPAKNVRTY